MERIKTITITEVKNNTDLYCRYAGQINAQRCFVWVSLSDREMGADYNPEIGNAVPSDVWEGKTRRYYLPAAIKAESANRLMEHLQPLVESLFDNAEVMLDVDTKIESAIEKWLDEEDYLKVYETSEWFSGASNDDLGITANTTDEEIADIAKNLDSKFDTPDVLEGDVEQYLINRRDDLIEF